jgi:hypothetical protein
MDHTKQCKAQFVLANLHMASPKFPTRKKLVLNIMLLEGNFQVFQSSMFAFHILHKVTMMEQLQRNSMVTTCITIKFEKLAGPVIRSPR